nr:basic salivary proline-rich protein 2-like isoform X1 [Microcebus murinus]
MVPYGLWHPQSFQSSRLHSPPQAKDSLSQNHELLEGGKATDPSSALDQGEAKSDVDRSGESPGRPAGPTPGSSQELNPITGRSFGEPRSSEFKVSARALRLEVAGVGVWVGCLLDEVGQPSPARWRKHLPHHTQWAYQIPESGKGQPLGPTGSPGEVALARIPSPGWAQSALPSLAQREEGSPSEPAIQRRHQQQRPHPVPSRSPQGRELTQGAPAPSGLPSWDLPALQHPPERLGSSLGQERVELQKLQERDTPQSQRGADPDGQRGEASQGEDREATHCQRGKAHQDQSRDSAQGDNKVAARSQRENRPKCQRKASPQSQGMEILQSAEDRIPQAWEVAPGEVTAQPLEEGGPPGQPRDFCGSLGEQIPPTGEKNSQGPGGRSTWLMQGKTEGQRQDSAKPGAAPEGAWAALPGRRAPARRRLPGPGAVMPRSLRLGDSGQQALPAALPGLARDSHALQGPVGQQVDEARLPGALWERRGGPKGPESSKAAWPAPAGRGTERADASAAQQEALQRLLELHGAARRRQRRDREQQRLRVLERLGIARNRHCRVHPLGLPPSPAQLWPQEDAAGRRHALREQLEQVHRERTEWLQALRTRNTQNFQELLWPPGGEEPASGRDSSSWSSLEILEHR